MDTTIQRAKPATRDALSFQRRSPVRERRVSRLPARATFGDEEMGAAACRMPFFVIADGVPSRGMAWPQGPGLRG